MKQRVDLDFVGSAALLVGGSAGTSGQVLTSAGTGATPTWATPPGSPGGADTEVQFNLAGAFAGNANMTFDNVTGRLTLINDATIGSMDIGQGAFNSKNVQIGGGLYSNVSADHNIAIGHSENVDYPLAVLEEGGHNIVLGSDATAASMYLAHAIVIGTRAMELAGFDTNDYEVVNATAIQPDCFYEILTVGTSNFLTCGASSNTVGTRFIANNLGTGSGTVKIFSSREIAIGTRAMQISPFGRDNVVIGVRAMSANDGYAFAPFNVGESYIIGSVGSTNWTAIGAASNTKGLRFTATGAGSGTDYALSPNEYNVAIGTYSLLQSQGSRNIAVGAFSLTNVAAASNNIGIGYSAGSDITTGSNNLLLGGYAGTTSLAGNIVFSTPTGTIRLQHNGSQWTSATPMSMTGLILPSTTSPITLNASVGTAGQALLSAGAGATPTWGSPTVPLQSISNAAGNGTLSNGNNAISWGWTLTGAAVTAFGVVEAVAATGGVGSQVLVKIGTLAASTADPLQVQTRGVDTIRISRTGDVTITALNGTAGSGTVGSAVTVTTGAGAATSASGDLSVKSGSGGATSGASGSAVFGSGDTTNGVSGDVTIRVGQAGSAQAGALFIRGGESKAALSGNASAVIVQGGQNQTTSSMSPGIAGGPVTVIGGAGSTNTTGGAGGAVIVQGGPGGLAANGGNVTVQGGTAGATGNGGTATLAAGTRIGTGAGSAVNVTASPGVTSGAGGAVNISAGAGASAAGGDVSLAPGSGSTKGTVVVPTGYSFKMGTAAVTTTATDGFAYLSTCAGIPSGTPTAQTGTAPVVIDSTNNDIYMYTNSAWRKINGAGGGGSAPTYSEATLTWTNKKIQRFSIPIGGLTAGDRVLVSELGYTASGIDFDELEFEQTSYVAKCEVNGTLMIIGRSTNWINGDRIVSIAILP